MFTKLLPNLKIPSIHTKSPNTNKPTHSSLNITITNSGLRFLFFNFFFLMQFGYKPTNFSRGAVDDNNCISPLKITLCRNLFVSRICNDEARISSLVTGNLSALHHALQVLRDQPSQIRILKFELWTKSALLSIQNESVSRGLRNHNCF